jgi:protease-4
MEPAANNPFPKAESVQEKTPSRIPEIIYSVGQKLIKVWVGCTSLIGTIVLLSVFGIFLAVTSVSKHSPDKVISGHGPEKIAVINLSGEIADGESGGSLLSGPTSTITPSLIDSYVSKIQEDQQIKAIIFKLNSPGGTIVASDVIYEKITSLKESGVKIIFLYGDVAASGGYYISSHADKIVANPTTITGSIGVIAEVLNITGLYDKLGLKEEVYKTGKNKDLLNPARARTQEEKDIIQALLDQALEQFVDRVASGRSMSKEEVKKVADGRVYSGFDAKNLGLIDELGNFDKAVEVAKKETGLTDPQIIQFENPTFFGSLFSGKILNPLDLLNPSQNTDTGVKIKYILNF